MTNNEKRAERVYRAMLQRYDNAEHDTPEAITDCMVDLLHLSQQYGMDITDMMERAHDHYEEEARV